MVRASFRDAQTEGGTFPLPECLATKATEVSFYPYCGPRVLLQAAGVDDAFLEDADGLVKLLAHVVQVVDGL